MIMRRYLITTLICLTAFTAIRAQQNDSLLTLDRCIQLALENNAAGKTTANDLKAAVELRKEAFTKYFPEVAAAGMAFWTHKDVLQYNILDIVELGLINHGKLAGIQALQPVFMGGQIVNGNKLAAVGEEVARLRKAQTTDQLRLNTETMFWKLATLESTRTALNAAIATLDTLTNQIKVAVDAGIATKNDLLKVQLKRNTYRSERVDLDNGIALMKMLLGQYIGRGLNTQFDIAEVVPDSVPQYPSDIYIPAEYALRSTNDYKLLVEDIKAKKLEKRIEIGRNLPSVAVGAGWYYHDVLRQNHNFGALMVTVTVPLTAWWGGSHAIKRKSIALENARLQFDDLSQKIELEMQDKWNDLTAAHRKMEIAAEGIGQSNENLRLNKLYYEAGMSTITDLLEAEASHKETIDNYIAAYGAFRVARAAYLITTAQEAK